MTVSMSFPMRRRHWLLTALAALSGCGGGVDSGGTGTGAITLAVGPISGLGSIFVNGVRYDDSAATVGGDIDPGQTLALGMQTQVLASAIVTSGGVSTATAYDVRVRREIVGPVQVVDVAGARLTVLGQTVAVNAKTAFDASIAGGLAGLAAGQIVAVYGTYDVNAARYVATRIERKTSVATYALRGVVAGLDLAARTLTVGALAVDWSAAAPPDPATTLAPGRYVSLRLATAPTAGVWTATALEVGVPVPADRERAEVEGRVSAFTSATDFAVDGLRIDASAAAFPDGTAGLVLGAKVEVKGRIRSGVLVADKVSLEDDDEHDPEAFELSGTISTIDVGARAFTVRGVTVQWTVGAGATTFEGGTVGDLGVGVKVEVKGVLSADGTRVVATRIHVER